MLLLLPVWAAVAVPPGQHKLRVFLCVYSWKRARGRETETETETVPALDVEAVTPVAVFVSALDFTVH